MLPLEDQITEKIIGAAIEVHRTLGPGLLESAYEECLCYELAHAGIQFQRQVQLPVEYRLDLLVENRLTYLKVSKKNVGLLINFNAATLKQGLRRIVNDFKPQEPRRLGASAMNS